MMNFLGRVPVLVWFVVPTLIVLAVGVWFFTTNPAVLGEKTDSDKPVAVSKPVSGTVEYEIVGRNHIAAGTSGSGYNSNPPTSGPHWPAPGRNGIYDKQQADEQMIHNLEHGYVWVSYRVASQTAEASDGANVEGVTADEIKQLEEIVKEDSWKIVMAPREKNEKKIALAAWGRLLVLDSFDADKIKDFIKTYRNRAPEKTPD